MIFRQYMLTQSGADNLSTFLKLMFSRGMVGLYTVYK